MALRGIDEFPRDFKPAAHVTRAVCNSDCRSPIIFVEEDGDPFMSVCAVAKERGSAVWSFDMSANRSMANVMDYVEVGLNLGDWVYLANCDAVDETFFREVSRTLFQLQPAPDSCPRREYFRAFFTVAKPFDPNSPGVRHFPAMFLQYAIIARKISEKDPKWTRIIPADDPLFTNAQMRRQHRREQGRDSDSESDLDSDENITGKLFFRSAELHKTADNSPVTNAKDLFEKAMADEDLKTLRKLVEDADVDIERPLKCGMTPIQFACCRQLTNAAIELLALGASPSDPRASDKRPPIFMALDDIRLVKALLDAGADVYQKYQGYRLAAHPDTAPDVAAYVVDRIAELGM